MPRGPKEVVIFEDNDEILETLPEVLESFGHTILAICRDSKELEKFLDGFSGSTENLILVADGDTGEESDQEYVGGKPPKDEIRNRDGMNAVLAWKNKFKGTPPYTLGRAAFGFVPGADWQLPKNSGGGSFDLAKVIEIIPDIPSSTPQD